ncbi:dipeptidase [Flagellatimonas centrodinii]|uniref:dipeptidase n=1 Tax=Flagellatimonas centrodinii TaxID=2806210 RepID=UPI001FEF766C|nr:dipeptidase [Flagellatimonas centrodinii]ULQ46730.1 dipeptidase [Flagellatimonas centrodinii]
MSLSPTRLPLAVLLLSSALCACSAGTGLTPPGADQRATDNPFATAAAADAAPRYRLANGCYRLITAEGRGHVSAFDDGSLAVIGSDAPAATPFFMKPTGLGHYVIYGPQGRYLTLAASAEDLATGLEGLVSQLGFTASGVGDLLELTPSVAPAADLVNALGDVVSGLGGSLAAVLTAGDRSLVMQTTPVDGSEWTVLESAQDGVFRVENRLTGDPLLPHTGGSGFRFIGTSGCQPYPEAALNATGTPFAGTRPDGTVFGYAETHMHLGGTEMFGGKLGYGRPFHKFGIPHALGDCAVHHGPGGVLGALDTAVDPEQGLPPHQTEGWPHYPDWPSWGSQIHHQTYYRWLERAWMGGLRLMVNHLVSNEGLCLIWPVKGTDCNEMENIELQRQLTLDLQDYIDAQAGGPGKGFFRIVYSPFEARQAIEAGQMAVVLGTENEKIFNCGEFLDQPDCSVADIDRELARWWDRGIRAIFPIHLVDNAFGGARLTDDPFLFQLYNLANTVDTGHPYAGVPCEGPDSLAPGEAMTQSAGIFDTVLRLLNPPLPPVTGCRRNARGLTPLGEYFIHKLIDRGVMIETDHTGVLARNRIFDLAEARGVPVFSGHTGTISIADKDSDRILQTGGIISNLPDDPSPDTVAFIQDLEALYQATFGHTRGLSTGLGSDINGIHNQAPPRADASERPLQYPFRSWDGQVTFDRQTTGERVFDLNTDGVAHYGLYPDYIADMQMQPGGEQALRYLFRSAEGYLQAWERVWAAAQP